MLYEKCYNIKKVRLNVLISSEKGIVQQFSAEIIPYANALTSRLVQTFFKYTLKDVGPEQDTEESNDADDSEISASGILETIKRILLAKLPEECYGQISDHLCQIFYFAFSEQGADYLEEATAILNIVLHNCKVVPQKIWFFYPILGYLMLGVPQTPPTAMLNLSTEQKELLENTKEGWAAEEIQFFIGCLKNFIKKGGDFFLTAKDFWGKSFIQLIFEIMQKVFTIFQNGPSDIEMICSLTIYLSLIENHFGKIDPYIPLILDHCTSIIFSNMLEKVTLMAFEVVCLYY